MPDFTVSLIQSERIFMVDFVRAKSGASHRRFPDIDNVGYRDEANAGDHGPITSAMVGQTRVTVRFQRTEISTRAKLFVVSTNPAAISITNPAPGRPLSASRTHDIEFSALAAGRSKLEIRYQFEDGPVLGEMSVVAYDRIQIPMQVHLLTVNGANQPRTFLSQACANRAARVARVTDFVNRANEAWVPHGVVFTITGFVDTVWGAAEVPSGAVAPTVVETVVAGMNSPGRSAVAVNVFVVPAVTGGVTGIGISTASAVGMGLVSPAAPPHVRHGSGLYLNASSSATPQTIAHEMGHYMSLCGLPNQGHSTGDLNVPAGTHTRDDLVSRRRLMYPIVSLPNAAPNNWRNDTGYGSQKAGSYLTYRRLPAAQDFTYEESARARAATLAPNFIVR